jgi:hypothetical protein
VAAAVSRYSSPVAAAPVLLIISAQLPMQKQAIGAGGQAQ